MFLSVDTTCYTFTLQSTALCQIKRIKAPSERHLKDYFTSKQLKEAKSEVNGGVKHLRG